MQPLLILIVSLLACAGCKKDPPPKAAPAPTLKRQRILRFEIESADISDVPRGGDEAASLKSLLAKFGLYIYLPEKEAQGCWVGFAGAAGSYATSGYTRALFKQDATAVSLEPFHLGVQMRDGHRLDLEFSRVRLRPTGAMPDDGVLDADLQLDGKAVFAITTGDAALSGTVDGAWRGRHDDSPPEPQLSVPPGGLVSGAVRILFDEPVSTQDMQERFFLRDALSDRVDVDVVPARTDLRDATTEVVMTPRLLLPFNARLSVAISADVKDMLGRPLGKPFVATFDTAPAPPYLQSTIHDFALSRGVTELTALGDVEFLSSFGEVTPSSGRLMRLAPPSPLADSVSGIMTRLVVPGSAKQLTVRARKIARTRDTDSPCLTVIVAGMTGAIWAVECGLTEAPRATLVGPDAEWLGTDWVNISLPLTGQRGTEVILIVEAKPRTATMSPTMDTQFLVDRISVDVGP